MEMPIYDPIRKKVKNRKYEGVELPLGTKMVLPDCTKHRSVIQAK